MLLGSVATWLSLQFIRVQGYWKSLEVGLQHAVCLGMDRKQVPLGSCGRVCVSDRGGPAAAAPCSAPGIAAGPCSSGELLGFCQGWCPTRSASWTEITSSSGSVGKEGEVEQGRGALFAVCFPCSLWGKLCQTHTVGMVPRAVPGRCLHWNHLLQNKHLEVQSLCCCCLGI